jgi:inorganic phosphate transporter, PiT family
VLTPRWAVLMAVVFNILGAMGGTAVAATVGRGIVEPAALTIPAITATMLSIIAWGTIAARLPTPQPGTPLGVSCE